VISTTVAIIRANRDVYLKVPDSFCIFRDPDLLPLHDALTADVPYFIQLEYSVSGIPDEENAYVSYSFDYSKGKIRIGEADKRQVPKAILIREHLSTRLAEIQTLLLPFTGVFAFNYPNLQGWFTPLGPDAPDPHSRYGQLGFIYRGGIAEVDTLHQVPNEEYFCDPIVLTLRNADSGAELQFVRLSDMFSAFDGASDSIKEAVLRASRQLHKAEGLLSLDPIAKFLYQVYAIESLIDEEHPLRHIPTCDHCGQKTFSVRRKFHEFTKKYCNSYTKKAVDEIYELRSAIVHKGELLIEPGLFLYERSVREFEARYLNEETMRLASAMARESVNKFLFLNSARMIERFAFKH